MLELPAADAAALDRPIWMALNTAHRGLALGGRHAVRYPPEVAPFAAVADGSPDAMAGLRDLAEAGPVAVLSCAAVAAMEGLEIRRASACRQMLAVAAATVLPRAPMVPLGADDVPAMLALTALTRPGPFQRRTHELGRYIGIRDEGTLVAMAGERMRFGRHTEVSAVCVHPGYRGRGYARMLVGALTAEIQARGETAFLHVFDDNLDAIALYERMGFVTRRTLQVTILQRSDGAISPRA